VPGGGVPGGGEPGGGVPAGPGALGFTVDPRQDAGFPCDSRRIAGRRVADGVIGVRRDWVQRNRSHLRVGAPPCAI